MAALLQLRPLDASGRGFAGPARTGVTRGLDAARLPGAVLEFLRPSRARARFRSAFHLALLLSWCRIDFAIGPDRVEPTGRPLDDDCRGPAVFAALVCQIDGDPRCRPLVRKQSAQV